MFNREIDLEGCLQQYIENKLTCSIPWGPRNFSHYSTCETKKQLIRYYKMVLKIRFLGERGIYEETGCKSSCHVNIYKLNKRFNFRDYSVKDQVMYFTNHQLFQDPIAILFPPDWVLFLLQWRETQEVNSALHLQHNRLYCRHWRLHGDKIWIFVNPCIYTICTFRASAWVWVSSPFMILS